MPRTKLKLRRLYSKKLFLKLGLILKTACHDYSESPEILKFILREYEV